MEGDIKFITEMVKKESVFVEKIKSEVSKVIVGQTKMVESILIGLLCGGHILIEGVPGLAKTLTVKTTSDTINTKFHRIQFTPDLLPADIIGTLIYNQNTGAFSVKKGPIFANLILADEINRAPAKVQSALLEAMQEKQVTIGDTTYKLDEPFIVLATQNPIEQEGTYPLPEAQIDRFMLKIKVSYPTKAEEREIMDKMSTGMFLKAEKVIEPADLIKVRELVNQVYIDEKIRQYIVNLVFASRKPEEFKLDEIKPFIQWGASPRASIYLSMTSRAHAFLMHRGYVIPEDIKSIGMDILRHRIIPTYEAEAEEITSENIIQKIFDKVEVP